MCDFKLNKHEFTYITDRLSQFYINNESPFEFLESVQYRIPLQDYLCACYGVERSSCRSRRIEFFRFMGIVNNNGGYIIQNYVLPIQSSEEDEVLFVCEEPILINDCNHLRQNIFDFQDKTSLFRSTLFYNKQSNQLFRIHCVFQFITLPVYISFYNPVNESQILYHQFLVSLPKKKQILKRLLKQISLCEASIAAHGTLECSLSQSSDKI